MFLNQRKNWLLKSGQDDYRTNKEKSAISQLSKINPYYLKTDL